MYYPRVCPKCGSKDAYIYESRLNKRGVYIRRRRCRNCYYTWKTAEIPYELLVGGAKKGEQKK